MDPARLRNIPVFSDLSHEELTYVAALAAEVSVPEGKELVREGDYSYDVLAIEEGTASVERHGEHIADLGPGDVARTVALRWSRSRTPISPMTSPGPRSAMCWPPRSTRAVPSSMARTS